ncbi:SDR family NAD(P)-dependent oxidoreductase [Shewanella psychrotolerans]|uniref:SDR family NAD(P)-dependent oxidoreductase n=1 Tax=Shewanella psychrotolerans TaxID=2864206 RepID=UPI001C65C17F|nr:SDR family NAD(P)-dependent oxidoreductase [Shewanella psychrotolerans]QYK02583.1 SDR family NAD(P)-dependent oxidoreductase [Shewanella psychrotolerans]
MRFDEQVAVVTGAGAGLGRAYAIALAARGARIALIDSGYSDAKEPNRRYSELDNTVKTLNQLGADTLSFAIDVRDETALIDAVHNIHEKWGQIDILIHNASIHHPCPFDLLTKDRWQHQLDVDVNGCFYLTKLIWPLMKLQSYGRILISSAASGLYGNMYETSFSTSKMALVGLANSLAMEGKEYNICVNTITPHALTQMTEHHLAPSVKPLFTTSSVTAAMLFLSSEHAPTGQHLLVAAGSVSRGGFTEYQHIRLDEEHCKPEVLLHRWLEIERAAPCCQHPSAEDQVTAWAKRSALERHIIIE